MRLILVRFQLDKMFPSELVLLERRSFQVRFQKLRPLARVEQGVTIFPVLIDIDNKDNLLLLGMNTDVVIQVVDKDVALSAPTGGFEN